MPNVPKIEFIREEYETNTWYFHIRVNDKPFTIELYETSDIPLGQQLCFELRRILEVNEAHNGGLQNTQIT